VNTQNRRVRSGVNVFFLIAATAVVIVVAIAGGVFGYTLYLKNARDTKAALLATAEQSINVDQVEGFIRLRDRLTTADTLLDEHIRLSEFFSILEMRTLQSVRFSTLSISVKDDRAAEIRMEGVARSFNALAAQSAEFAAEKRIKRAIFSSIAVNENGTVAFSLSAEADARLITAADRFIPPVPAASTQPVPDDSSASTSVPVEAGTSTSQSQL